MSSEQKFFFCKVCGSIVGRFYNKGKLICCKEEMTELIPNTVDASTEKHLPAVTVSGNVIDVAVGSALHPMEEAHHINFVYLATKRGGQRKTLVVGETPKLAFSVTDDEPVAVFAYCNLHGLWKTDVV